jgi:hypothetical protein
MESFPPQIRIRTRDELATRRKVFFELDDLLRKLDVPFFLCLGTLLGAVRERDFIAWDWDVELGVKTADIFGKKEGLMRALEAAGFTIKKTDFSYENFKVDVAKYDSPEASSYTIMGWHRTQECWRRNKLLMPAAFLDTLDSIEFLGQRFACPREPERYLEFQYGKDWRTPKRSDDPEEYWTRVSFPGGDVTRGGRLGVFARRVRKVIARILRQ